MGKKVIIGALALFFIALAAYSMRGMFTTYVAFKDAMESDRFVQVIGALEKVAPVERFEGGYSFTLRDNDGTVMKVSAKGVEPANLTHADRVVVLGSYSAQSQQFVADKVLVKCPSKYTKEKRQ
jgi:cytochrome c-type biogenesis protein CcmE